MHLLSGNEYGIQRWRLEDGQEVGRQTGMKLRAISVSRDGKWIVCGTVKGASVWDSRMHAKVIDVEGVNGVVAVDVSPDSARFATGTATNDNTASIWSITTGQRLVGPLQYDDRVTGVKFSPNGEHFAIARFGGSIRIFNSHNGDGLIAINTLIPELSPITPLAWSSDSQRIFSACRDNNIRAFNVSTQGSQLTGSLILSGGSNGHDVYSISLAPNGKFIAIVARQSVSFLDTLTLEQIGPVIQDSRHMRSITVSPDSRYLTTGDLDGKIFIHDLGNILSDSYGPFYVSSICNFVILASWTSPIPSPMPTNYLGAHQR